MLAVPTVHYVGAVLFCPFVGLLSAYEIMIHQPAIHGNGIQGQATDIKITSDHIQKSKKRLNTILSENTGKSIDEVAIATERDNYMTAKEAMDFGLIDKILTKR